MSATGRIVGFLTEIERRHTPRPRRPSRPLECPACHSEDIHGARPCPRRKDLDDEPARRDHDWHCHACRWSAHVGDDPDDW